MTEHTWSIVDGMLNYGPTALFTDVEALALQADDSGTGVFLAVQPSSPNAKWG